MTSSTARRRRRRCAIGFDVGATKVAAGVVTADGDIVERIPPVPSPATGPEATLTLLNRVITDLRTRHSGVEAVGVGAAGLIEWPEGFIRWAPNNAYHALPLRRLLRDATDLPTVVDNDANTAAWAEARIGNKASYMAFLTVGTGIGGGLILNNRLYRGKTGIGAEVGHLIIDPAGDHRCNCGSIGCLEALASGTALGRYGRTAAAAEPNGLLATLANEMDSPVTGEIVFAAALKSDPTALALFERMGHWFGIGIASLVNLFDLELIVVGGGVAAQAPDLLLAPTRASFERFLFAREHRQRPPILPARLGADAGWIGAAMLALDPQDTIKGCVAPDGRNGSLSPNNLSIDWSPLSNSVKAVD